MEAVDVVGATASAAGAGTDPVDRDDLTFAPPASLEPLAPLADAGSPGPLPPQHTTPAPLEPLVPLADAVLRPLTAHRLLVQMRVTRPIHLHEHQGAALRGAFFGTLRSRFCVRQELTSCQPCTLHVVCPISALVATVDDASSRGLDVERPFTIEPPLDRRALYPAGSAYRFGLTLLGRARDLLPYALIGLQDLGSDRFGARAPDGSAGAGRLRLERVDAWNPITGARQSVYAAPVLGQPVPIDRPDQPARASRGSSAGASHLPATSAKPAVTVRAPAVPVTHGDILARAARWQGHDRVTLRLLTPLRLIAPRDPQKHPVRQFDAGLFLRRLAGRLEALAVRYGDTSATTPPPGTSGIPSPSGTPGGAGGAGVGRLGAAGAAALGAAAGQVQVFDDRTRFVDVRSHSSRQGKRTPLGGLVGTITLGGPPDLLAVFLPWLVWGEIAHAGKEATRGHGWYELVER